jgi:hypothetical protein
MRPRRLAAKGPKNQQYCSRAWVPKAADWRNPAAYRKRRLKSYRRQEEEVSKK